VVRYGASWPTKVLLGKSRIPRLRKRNLPVKRSAEVKNLLLVSTILTVVSIALTLVEIALMVK